MYKYFLKRIIQFFWISLFCLFFLNYIVDPYGYQNRDGKFIKNLSMLNKPNVTNARINSDGYYYLIGSSRMARVDPNTIEFISNKKTHNIKLDGATLKENILLSSKVKDNEKFFIFSFDAFSNNFNREKFPEINSRYSIYASELESSNFFER